MTLACFSEHTTAYWLSLRSWDVEGDTETGLRLRTFSLSSPSAVMLGSYQGSYAWDRSEPDESRKAIRKMLPFSRTNMPDEWKNNSLLLKSKSKPVALTRCIDLP